MENLKDAFYFQLPSQGSIYTVADLQLANGCRKLLVASLKREIFCLEYLDSMNDLVLTIKEISFTYIPSGAEIISIDAFNKSLTKNEFVVGVTIIKNSNELDSLETFLNIYSEWEESDDFNIENIAQNCLNVELNYIPYKLLHTYLVLRQDDQLTKEIVFVLSGSDHQVHVYREHTTDHVYKEVENKDFFPEFTKTPSPVVWVDILYSDDFGIRTTAIACECGYVKLTKVCTITNEVVCNFSVRFSNYVAKVQIYYENVLQRGPLSKLKQICDKDNNEWQPVLNLIVVNSILPAVVFCDIFKFGLSKYQTLPRLDNGTSTLTCCEIVDVNFHGTPEILLGNTGREIMLLKFNGKDESWCLEELKKIAAPLLHLKYIDISGDGVKELVVLSMKGVHIFQHEIGHVQKTLCKKVKKLNAVAV